MWPADPEALVAAQRTLAEGAPTPWHPAAETLVAACWVCFPRGLTGRGSVDDEAWAAAVVMREGRVVEQQVVHGRAGAPYQPGLLALRLGPLMAHAVRTLTTRPEVVMLDASGRDHPRRAGLALHLGAVLDVPTVGVTHRPLLAQGDWPEDVQGATSALRIGDTVVARWVRTRAGARPLVVHPGWAVDLDTAVEVVLSTTSGRRTPEPLRRARHLARRARAAASPSTSGVS